MNLYKLVLKDPRAFGFYDIAWGYVIRAASESEARRIANEVNQDPRDPWLNPEHTTCEVLTADGETGIILTDFNAS